MSKHLLIAPVLLAAALWPHGAGAQTGCAVRDAIVARLAESYGQVRTDGAAAGALSFYEVFASEATGTWTVLLSGVNGISCIMAAGDGWQPEAASRDRLGSADRGERRVK